MYDFCVNGAGMTGAATALGLIQQGYSVALLEPRLPEPFNAEQPPDLRVSAISLASARMLEALGAWQHIPVARIRKYDRLSVWEDDGARTDFDAGMADTDTLGYFIENRLIQLACLQAAQENAHSQKLSLFQAAPASIQFNQNVDGESVANLLLDSEQTISARWVIGADGAQSVVRREAGIGVSGWQYEQHALGVVVKLDEPVADWTWQEFHSSGPRAFLPMYDNMGSFIWYDSATTVKQLSRMDHTTLKQRIADAFPAHAGNFSVVGKAAFPLTRMHAQHYLRHQAILLGDAAHTINPLAGQGVNIGFKDVALLLNLISTCENISALDEVLAQKYEPVRRRDNLAMMSAMDGFYWLFSNDNPPVKWLRNKMLRVAQRAIPAKRLVLKYAMGIQ
ncbi:2-octaprenyl-3-methyl-6-methoxy-1,4-benzoquinol hydroxylase [Salinimonas sp. HHU 13199]|uniref:2-octaprenyl-3-methyl-6-methoxy-1,4-benzoquinol hydroxylase n=1 Tax=Salinimonas profundi TaxID=2729140 RepID=A0ABR8LFF3_9ALTE|nr:FAD-dependent monooxygenase [Salinimonas profundi]MBD3584987.1 2-octaprenyl-3-methyl-6-methoxy-1,4-benzoquinol hydroxylase [Salinimonas profundi]